MRKIDNKRGSTDTILLSYGADLPKDGQMIVVADHTKILLRKKFTGYKLAVILIHEFTHLVNYIVGVKGSIEDEAIADAIASKYYQYLYQKNTSTIKAELDKWRKIHKKEK